MYLKTVVAGFLLSVSICVADTQSVSADAGNKVCEKYGWSEVEDLARPFLSDVLYTALVMQGQSADYRASSAAEQALEPHMPEHVKEILRAIIEANC